MSDFTDYLETAIRDWMSQNTSMPATPTDLYVGLHTSDPTDSPGGTTEVSAADYSRVGVPCPGGWATPTTNSFENANVVNFGTTTNSWGSVSHVALYDASTGGNALATFALNSTNSISSGEDVTFPAGQLSFNID